MSERVVVVGAGVIGLLTARELALAGLRVTLVERGESGREASWAGGGIVSPLYPWRYSPAVTALAHWSQDFYPALGQRLLDETGLDPEVHTVGLYWLDLDDQTEALQWARKHTRPLKCRSRRPTRRCPGWAPASSRRSTCRAWPMCAILAWRAHCGHPCNNSPISNCMSRRRCAAGCATAIEWSAWRPRVARSVATKVLLAAGAWSGELLKPLGLELPVVPVKGQMILYKCAADFLPRMVQPGALRDSAARRPHPDRQHLGTFGLRQDADRRGAGKPQGVCGRTVAGTGGHAAGGPLGRVAPGLSRRHPYIGPVPGFDGLWLNTGHYRNGLVLAPASCRLLADLMSGREPIIDPVPYAPAGRL